jgi:hypothetical protein
MTNIYCGIKKVPSNSRLGTMKECAEKKQIKYYGVKKIDNKLLEIAIGAKKDKNTRENALKEVFKLKGRVKNLEGKLQVTKDKEAKEEIKKDIEKIKKDIVKWNVKIEELSKKKLSRTGSKKGSKKVSKKTSKKLSKKGSKKASKKGSKKA